MAVQNIIKFIKTHRKILIFLICFFISLLLGYISLILSYRFDEKSIQKINYTEKGTSDFKVYLKDNVYYEDKYLDDGMNYISNLIDKVIINYNYAINASKKIDFDYKYNIYAKIIIMERNDEKKILFSKTYNLKNKKEEQINDTDMLINDGVEIDYAEYNDYVNKYKKDYSLNANAKLVVTMDVEASSKFLDSSIEKNNKLEVTIPLSQQTIDITRDTPEIFNNEVWIVKNENSIYEIVFFVSSILLFAICFYFIIRIVILIINFKNSKSVYQVTIKKYLKEYDRAIVEIEDSQINENDFDNIIKVKTITELLDLHDNFKYPILHYETKKDSKSDFVIIKDNTLYKLTITKESLENKNGAQ